MTTARLRQLLVVTTLGAATVVAAPVAATAETDGAANAQTLVDALVAAGVPGESIDDDFTDRLRRSVVELVESGVIEGDALDRLRDAVRDGNADRAIKKRVTIGRERRAEYREAVDTALAGLGIERQDGQSARQALRAAGYAPDELRDLLSKPNRDRQGRPDADRTDVGTSVDVPERDPAEGSDAKREAGKRDGVKRVSGRRDSGKRDAWKRSGAKQVAARRDSDTRELGATDEAERAGTGERASGGDNAAIGAGSGEQARSAAGEGDRSINDRRTRGRRTSDRPGRRTAAMSPTPDSREQGGRGE